MSVQFSNPDRYAQRVEENFFLSFRRKGGREEINKKEKEKERGREGAMERRARKKRN